MHVTQYQKANPDDPSSHYHLDITIFDAAQKEIGRVTNQDAPAGQGVGVTSALPWVFIATAQNVDDDALLFKYADQSWGSNDQEHHCDFGGFEDGNRYVLNSMLSRFDVGQETDELMFLGTATVASLARGSAKVPRAIYAVLYLGCLGFRLYK